jgi:hypothetical protein
MAENGEYRMKKNAIMARFIFDLGCKTFMGGAGLVFIFAYYIKAILVF